MPSEERGATVMAEEHTYAERRARFIRGNGMKCVLHLFDVGAFQRSGATSMPQTQPGLSYGKEIGWIGEENGLYWLTNDGISVGAQLASKREDWFLEMAGWQPREG